jgi:hypothetical protein
MGRVYYGWGGLATVAPGRSTPARWLVAYLNHCGTDGTLKPLKNQCKLGRLSTLYSTDVLKIGAYLTVYHLNRTIKFAKDDLHRANFTFTRVPVARLRITIRAICAIHPCGRFWKDYVLATDISAVSVIVMT